MIPRREDIFSSNHKVIITPNAIRNDSVTCGVGGGGLELSASPGGAWRHAREGEGLGEEASAAISAGLGAALQSRAGLVPHHHGCSLRRTHGY